MIDTSRYQWAIGGFGLVMLVVFSLVLFTHSHHTSPGVAPGQRLRRFVAPLALGGPDDSANTSPVCNPAKPAVGGLNVCDRTAIVLDFFAVDGSACVSSVDALQRVADAWNRTGAAPPGRRAQRVVFAAVAAGGSREATRALVRAHHWTIPVGVDPSASVGELYDVTICPMIEVAGAGGVVKRLLIGERYARAGALQAAVDSAFGRSQ